MRLPHLVASVIATSLLVVGAADAAPGKKPRAPRVPSAPPTYTATLSASLQSTYANPKNYGHSDCFHRHWSETEGTEDWTFRSRRPVAVQPVNLTPDLVSFVTRLPAGGRIVRTYRGARGADPGNCGGGSPTQRWSAKDCGPHLVGYDVAIAVNKGRMSILPLAEAGAIAGQGGSHDCEIPKLKAVGSGWPEKITAPVSVRALRAGRPVTAKVRKTWNETTRGIGSSRHVYRTTLTWTVDLVPAGRR